MKEQKKIWMGLGVVIILWLLGQYVYKRFDFTLSKQYTLSEATKKMVDKVDAPLKIEIFLTGEIPADYRFLKNETQFFVEELQELNHLVTYEFVDLKEKKIPTDTLIKRGLYPAPIPTDNGYLEVYPYAKITYQNKPSRLFSLLIDKNSIPLEERATPSVEKLEYKFVNEIEKVISNQEKRIAFLAHHDELLPEKLMGFLQNAGQKYFIEPYLKPLQDSSYTLKKEDLNELLSYDALLIPKPVKPFTEEDKVVLDQYIMKGGKTLWMLENVDAEMDSLMRGQERILAFQRDLNLTDLLFAYGFRLNQGVVLNPEAAQIVLATGEVGGNTAYSNFPWFYFPLGFAGQKHAINNNLDPVRFEFANPLEFLPKEGVKYTVLLQTAPQSAIQKAMSFITLDAIDSYDPELFTYGSIPLAVLAEGTFPSAYAGRIERKEIPDFKTQSVPNKMVVISDGDVIKNHIFQGNPMQLGADKYSLRPDRPNQPPYAYDNLDFLLNVIDYLIDDNQIMELRNREIEIPKLNKSRVENYGSFWRWTNLLLPVGIIWCLGAFMIYRRKKKFSNKMIEKPATVENIE